MRRIFAGISSAVCVVAFVLSGCSNSSSSTEMERVDGVPVDAEQGPVPQNDDGSSGGDPQSPPTVATPPIDDMSTDSNDGPEGDSAIVLDARRYPLNAAIGDIWGVENQHYNVNFTLTDGKFTITPTTIDGVTYNLLTPAKASGIFHAEMYSPGDAFSFDTYSFSRAGVDRDALAGVAFFDNAYIGLDENNSGDVDDDEIQTVIGGLVAFTGAVPDIELTFNVLLSNGQSAQGHYTGLFDFTER